MEEVILDQCSTCPGHCCILLSLPLDKEELMKRAQNTALRLIHRKDALKAYRWMREPERTDRYYKLKDTNPEWNIYTCTKLVDGKCSVYNIRPSFCKQYGRGCDPSETFNSIPLEKIGVY
jgi:Fe-S-cluster containining protein